MGSNSKGGARKTPVIGSWKDSTTNKFGSRNRPFHSIKNDTSSDREQILSAEESAGIRKTTNVELFYHENGGKRKANDGLIEMA